jgi:hypothetical protein
MLGQLTSIDSEPRYEPPSSSSRNFRKEPSTLAFRASWLGVNCKCAGLDETSAALTGYRRTWNSVIETDSKKTCSNKNRAGWARDAKSRAGWNGVLGLALPILQDFDSFTKLFVGLRSFGLILVGGSRLLIFVGKRSVLVSISH